MVNLFRMISVDNFEEIALNFDIVRVGVVMPAQKPVLFASQPSLLERELINVALIFVYFKVDIIRAKHVLAEEQ